MGQPFSVVLGQEMAVGSLRAGDIVTVSATGAVRVVIAARRGNHASAIKPLPYGYKAVDYANLRLTLRRVD